MVRVASLRDMVHADYKKADIAGMTATEQLEKINVATRELVELQYSTYNRSLVPQLEAKGIRIIDAFEELTAEQQEFVDKYFEETVYPVLTPMAVDASRPFPLIRNKTLNIAAFLLKKGEKKKEENYEFATVQVPGVLPRIIPIPDGENHSFILLEQIIEKNMERLFLNYDVICAYPYRIMRNADLTIDEDEAEDLLQEIQKQLKKRQWGEIIRLEVEDKIDKKLLHFLKEELQIPKDDIYKINGPLDLTFLMKVYGIEGCDDDGVMHRTNRRRCQKSRQAATSLRRSEKKIFCYIIHTRPLIRSWILSVRRQWTRMYLPSNRPCTVSAVIRRSLHLWH